MLDEITSVEVRQWEDNDATRDRVLGPPIVIARGLIPVDEPKFELEELRRSYGSRRVDMVVQLPIDELPGEGWDLPPQWSRNASLGPYIDRMILERGRVESESGREGAFEPGSDEEGDEPSASRSMMVTPPRDTSRGRKRPVLRCGRMKTFAANVDMDKMTDQLDSLEAMMPTYLRWGGEFDMLRFARQTVPGVTFPQLYFKVEGNWTGGHEENLRLSSVNCNHGPGSSRWYAIDAEHAGRLREFVSRNYSVDIYVREGNWWPRDLKSIVEAGIPVRTGIQRPGDVVVLRGSTLHWVVAESPAVHSSWNFGVCDAAQLKEALDRAILNDLRQTCVPNIVPVRTLVCDLARAILDETKPGRRHYLGGGGGGGVARRNRKDGNVVLTISSARRLTKVVEERPRASCERMLDRARSDKNLLEIVAACVANTLELEAVNIRKVARSRVTIELEPEGALVMRCDACAHELPLVYMRCNTCLGSKRHATKPFLCADCGAAHRSDLAHDKKHNVIAIAKGSLSELRRLAVRLESLRQRLATDGRPLLVTKDVGSATNRYRDRRLTETALFPVFDRAHVRRRAARTRQTTTSKARTSLNVFAASCSSRQPAPRLAVVESAGILLRRDERSEPAEVPPAKRPRLKKDQNKGAESAPQSLKKNKKKKARPPKTQHHFSAYSSAASAAVPPPPPYDVVVVGQRCSRGLQTERIYGAMADPRDATAKLISVRQQRSERLWHASPQQSSKRCESPPRTQSSRALAPRADDDDGADPCPTLASISPQILSAPNWYHGQGRAVSYENRAAARAYDALYDQRIFDGGVTYAQHDQRDPTWNCWSQVDETRAHYEAHVVGVSSEDVTNRFASLDMPSVVSSSVNRAETFDPLQYLAAATIDDFSNASPPGVFSQRSSPNDGNLQWSLDSSQQRVLPPGSGITFDSSRREPMLGRAASQCVPLGNESSQHVGVGLSQRTDIINASQHIPMMGADESFQLAQLESFQREPSSLESSQRVLLGMEAEQRALLGLESSSQRCLPTGFESSSQRCLPTGFESSSQRCFPMGFESSSQRLPMGFESSYHERLPMGFESSSHDHLPMGFETSSELRGLWSNQSMPTDVDPSQRIRSMALADVSRVFKTSAVNGYRVETPIQYADVPWEF
ncbi:hypothetical protein CTAYLR_005426 [Chrysophaeum taylorii]|uniref:JmjC domain-containing protein n=1 Tax=Chrysophaeum taylorii TaxID=2483200 RepID=A0AAD7UJN5_9STRA|nr:hypothetical protein CTAYLR_005426 [Chrysophaeum taylorii]